jgi:hypothetical protein
MHHFKRWIYHLEKLYKKKILYDSFEIFIYNLKGENLYIKKIG